jgi:hypothetical protein
MNVKGLEVTGIKKSLPIVISREILDKRINSI